MNLDSNDSRSASNTHHVLIKSVTVKKSIQPINQAFADEEDEPQGPHFKRAKLISTSDSNSLGWLICLVISVCYLFGQGYLWTCLFYLTKV